MQKGTRFWPLRSEQNLQSSNTAGRGPERGWEKSFRDFIPHNFFYAIVFVLLLQDEPQLGVGMRWFKAKRALGQGYFIIMLH